MTYVRIAIAFECCLQGRSDPQRSVHCIMLHVAIVAVQSCVIIICIAAAAAPAHDARTVHSQ
jgi:hypothetical protein